MGKLEQKILTFKYNCTQMHTVHKCNKYFPFDDVIDIKVTVNGLRQKLCTPT